MGPGRFSGLFRLRYPRELLAGLQDRTPSWRLLELPDAVPLDVSVERGGELLEAHARPVPPLKEAALERAEEPLRPRVVPAPRLARHRPHHVALLACRHPVARHVDRPSVAVQDQGPLLGGPHLRDEVREHGVSQLLVQVPGDPPAHRPAVEAVDRGRREGLVPVEAELRNVGHGEQPGLGRVEIVGAVPAERQVRRVLGELASVARVPRPARHLGGLARDEALLGHDRAHDLLGRDDGRRRVPRLEIAP